MNPSSRLGAVALASILLALAGCDRRGADVPAPSSAPMPSAAPTAPVPTPDTTPMPSPSASAARP